MQKGMILRFGKNNSYLEGTYETLTTPPQHSFLVTTK